MEGSSSQPSDSNMTASGASISLHNLPSRGLFSAPVLSLNPGRIRVCVCEYETSLPEDKHVKTDQQNILIRSLKIKKQKDKGDSSSKDAKGAGTAEVSRKRVAERVLDSRALVKKPSTQPRQEESSSQASSGDFQGLTVERLRALLKAKGLYVKGKKARGIDCTAAKFKCLSIVGSSDGAAHTEHEVVHWENRDKVRKWRAALTEVANLSGWDLKDVPEAVAINRIVKEIVDKSHLPAFTWAWYPWDGGKTAVALALYDQLSQDFDSSNEPSNVGELFRISGKKTSQYQIAEGVERCCFLSNVREMSLVSLQQKLLSKILKVQISNIENESAGADMIKKRLGNMRVLLVIDDVDQAAQLKYLARKRDWFGRGGRIIITTFNAHLLNDADTIYKAAWLTHDEALQLLSLKAFNECRPPEEYWRCATVFGICPGASISS